MKKIILSCLCIFGLLSIDAQVKNIKRIEIEDSKSQDLIEFGKSGFVLQSTEYPSGDDQELILDFYSKDLLKTKSKTVNIAKRKRFDVSFKGDDKYSALYKDEKGKYTLVTLDIKTEKINQIDGLFPKKTQVYKMSILGETAYFSTSINGSKFLFSINCVTGVQKQIPILIEGANPKKIFFESFQIMEKFNEILLYVYVPLKGKKNDYYIVKLDDKGNKKETFNLSKDIDKNLINVTGTRIDQNKYVFTGTYSSQSTSYSEGIFFFTLNNQKVENVNFYNYLDLQNFLNYLPEKTQKKIEKKEEKKEDHNKELTLNYLIAAHDLITTSDGYLLLGEAYFPTYRTEYYTTYVNGVATTQTRQVFDGYQYTHASLIKFSTSGKIVWDQCFEMWPGTKPYYVKKFISITDSNSDKISLAFASYNRIHTKSFDKNGKVLKDEKTESIETLFEGDKVKYSNSNTEYWYDNYFIIHGGQLIKNKEDKTVDKKRWVYFVNKIQY